MNIAVTPELREIWNQTLSALSGGARRIFMATVVKAAGRGGSAMAERELGWNRVTINKALRELEMGEPCSRPMVKLGRKPLESSHPQLEADLRAMGEASSLTDPTFGTTQLYRRLTGTEARRRLIQEKGYDPLTAPSARTLRRKLSALGFKPRKVGKTKPLKKIKETNAIFDEVQRTNKAAEADPGVIRLSLDTKAVVPIGNFSRGGKSRQGHQALDHDFEPDSKLTPFGIFRPETAETWLYFTSGNATADFMVDRLHELWPTLKKTVILHIPL